MASLEFHELQFNKKALELFNISEAMNDTWKINEKSEKFYLSKKKTISVESQQQPPDDDGSYSDDPSVAVPKDRDDSFSIEYHVLFHPSYQVPVLYFNAYNLDGSLISLEDVSRIFVDEFKSSTDEMQNIITQAEHPILFRPFFMLHPCKVHQVLSAFPQSKNFVLTYLTLFGPSVQLKMDPYYEKFYAE